MNLDRKSIASTQNYHWDGGVTSFVMPQSLCRKGFFRELAIDAEKPFRHAAGR
jgi:hypothetical protein